MKSNKTGDTYVTKSSRISRPPDRLAITMEGIVHLIVWWKVIQMSKNTNKHIVLV